MDDVKTVQDLKVFFPNVSSTFHVYPDPVFHPFEGGERVYKGEALILEVRATLKTPLSFIQLAVAE